MVGGRSPGAAGEEETVGLGGADCAFTGEGLGACEEPARKAAARATATAYRVVARCTRVRMRCGIDFPRQCRVGRLLVTGSGGNLPEHVPFGAARKPAVEKPLLDPRRDATASLDPPVRAGRPRTGGTWVCGPDCPEML